MIATALIFDPALLIADEPTTALDVTTQEQIFELIREMQESTKTAVLFITHDFGVVAEIADRVVVMNRGSTVEVGHTPADSGETPTQDYTRMLVSSVPSLWFPNRASPNRQDESSCRCGFLNKTYSEKRFLFADADASSRRPRT